MSAEPRPRPSQHSGVPVCRNCGALHTRRSRPHNAVERVLRAVTPLRFHVCAVCGVRGYHLGRRSHGTREEGLPSPLLIQSNSGHRWKRNALRERNRFLRTLVLAGLLGCAAALGFHACPTRGATMAVRE